MSSATIDYRDRPLGHGSWTREELIARLWLDKKQVSMIADFDLFIMGPCHRDATIDFFERASFMRRPVRTEAPSWCSQAAAAPTMNIFKGSCSTDGVR